MALNILIMIVVGFLLFTTYFYTRNRMPIMAIPCAIFAIAITAVHILGGTPFVMSNLAIMTGIAVRMITLVFFSVVGAGMYCCASFLTAAVWIPAIKAKNQKQRNIVSVAVLIAVFVAGACTYGYYSIL